MNDPSSAALIEQRLMRLEARAEIRNLITRYCVAIDDRDLAGIGACFAEQASFSSADGVMHATGRQAVVAQFEGRFAVLGPCFHFTHDHTLDFEDGSTTEAYGLVLSHAELWRHGAAYLAAMRYADRYVLERGAWCFASRVISFLYYAPIKDYPTLLGAPDRMRAYGDRRPADIPESLPTWRGYHGLV